MEKVLYTREPDENWQLALAVHTDLLQIGMPPVNLMLTGPIGPIEHILELLQTNCCGSVASWYPGQPLILPRVERVEMLILHNLGVLPYADQHRLLKWLDGDLCRTQVVSTAPEPLLPRVHSGEFIEALYYRLNILYVEVTESSLVPRAPLERPSHSATH